MLRACVWICVGELRECVWCLSELCVHVYLFMGAMDCLGNKWQLVSILIESGFSWYIKLPVFCGCLEFLSTRIKFISAHCTFVSACSSYAGVELTIVDCVRRVYLCWY